MLGHLHIENIAIMDNVSVTLENGFLALTGQTGAGKSIIIDSINLLTGERSSRELVKSGKDKAFVEGVIYTDNKEVFEILADSGIEANATDPIILSREITKDGRSTVRINGRITTTHLLKEVCSKIINIHGQNDNQSILDTKFHGLFLDSFAGLENEIEDYKKVYDEFKQTENLLKQTDENEEQKAQRKDFLEFQINEIEQAELTVGEDEELLTQRQRFLNNEKFEESINKSYYSLAGDNDFEGACSLVNSAQKGLEELSRFEPKAEEILNRIIEVKCELEDIKETVYDLKNDDEYSEIDINYVESRIDVINRLKRKFGGEIEDILAKKDELETELNSIENSDANKKMLKEKLELLELDLTKRAVKIEAARKSAAEKLKKEVSYQLKDLEMEKVEFDTQIKRCEPGMRGFNEVQFLISTNPGEPLKPLNKIASGGELSRIILALKVVLSSKDSVSTMIFDEVDVGVGGSAAQKIAEKLKSISKDRQVIVITHLAQIASFADHHYLISKNSENGNTYSEINLLNENERIDEIARIMSGSVITQSAKNTAIEMIKIAKEF
ncbi:MAG: DNA repair protein RecN [Clostridia bacterium]|nr:DNA repair protein RecN [Clostridia bacterium]